MPPIRPLIAAALLAATAGSALAQELPASVKARQGQFRILAYNLGVLGAMAKGEAEYDVDIASAAAGNIVAVTEINQALNWPEGTDMMSLDGTRAEPALWENFGDFQSKWEALGQPAEAMIAAAASGQEAIGPALGELGGACKNCHDEYRAPE